MNLSQNIKQKDKKAIVAKLLGATAVWQVAWLLALPLFQIRDKIISWGLVGPSCGECMDQTRSSIVMVMIPLFLGALVFNLALNSLLWKKNNLTDTLLRSLMIITFTALGTYFSFVIYGLLNFIINY